MDILTEIYTLSNSSFHVMNPYPAHPAPFFLLLLLMGFTTLNAQSIEVKIAGMDSTSGQIHIKTFKNDQSFKDDKEYGKP